MPKSTAKPKSPDQLTYEQAFEELEEIVGRLEEGELPLEQALTLFERGQTLAGRCAELLETAELKLRQLVPDDDQGAIETDFDMDEEDE